MFRLLRSSKYPGKNGCFGGQTHLDNDNSDTKNGSTNPEVWLPWYDTFVLEANVMAVLAVVTWTQRGKLRRTFICAAYILA